jgi:hypothetical protein
VSRRSPNNERYQKYTVPKGQTRKSSASAKPVRKEGGAAQKPKPKAGSKGSYYEPDTPEYKFWRRMWWISLGSGLALVVISFLIQYNLDRIQKFLGPAAPIRIFSFVIISASYACIIAAFFIDWKRMRPMRKGTYVPKADKPAKDELPPDVQ